MSERISVGVIGIGYGQQVHVPAFQSDDRCRVRAVCASSAERAREVAARLNIPSWFGSWQEMIDDPAIDAVSIAVPPALQTPIVLAAAAAKKHVFCEKPLAASARQARDMLQSVDNAGVVHAIDFIFPEIPAWQRAHQVLREGELGSLRQIYLNWHVETYAHRVNQNTWKRDRAIGGGTLNNFVSHSLYYLEWLFGPIKRIAARLTPRVAKGEARVDIWADFAGGFPGTLSVAADAFLGCGHGLDVHGEQGTLVLENRTSDYASGFRLAVGTRNSNSLAPIVPEHDPDPKRDGRIAATAAIVRRFLDAILLGRPMVPSLREGLRVQELIDLVRVADRTESWQIVDRAIAHAETLSSGESSAGNECGS